MEPAFTTLGALIGLLLAIALIIRKVTPVYALIFGALLGGLAGGGGLVATVSAMISGTQAMMPSVLRILASGILVGALVKTGSAAKIADAIVEALGSRFALAAVALATMIVTAVGVFVDIAVITVAPVALAVGRRANISIPALLLAMVGGGKAGNVLSPNPNTIAVAEAFKLDLTTVMAANLIPAVCALAMTVFLSSWLARRWRGDTCDEVKKLGEGEQRNCSTPSVDRHVKDANHHCSPSPLTFTSLSRSLLGPLTVIVLLALRPACRREQKACRAHMTHPHRRVFRVVKTRTRNLPVVRPSEPTVILRVGKAGDINGVSRKQRRCLRNRHSRFLSYLPRLTLTGTSDEFA